MNEETLLSIAISDVLILILCGQNKQDFLGTAVTIEVARRLGVPRMLLVMNEALTGMDLAAL